MSKKAAQLLLNAMLEKDQDNLIIALLKTIKEQYSVVELGREFFAQLQKIEPFITEKRTRAALIELMVEFPDFEFNFKILDEYLTLVEEYETSEEDAARFLQSFFVRNLFKVDILSRFAQFTDKLRALKILVKLGEYDWPNVPMEYQSFIEEVRVSIRLSSRIYLIAQFLYFVHPSYSAYSNIIEQSVRYPTYESAKNDWAWRLPDSTERITHMKIVTPSEAEVFIALGQILYNKKSRLTPVEQSRLYTAFFENRNPIDVFFNLPD